MKVDIVDDLKQPEYTGENRCEPCTILNLGIAVVVGSLVARRSRIGGILAISISIALIYLRGYLVPGTPTLTKRYLPPAVLRWFGKDPEPEVAQGVGSVDIEPSTDTDETTDDATDGENDADDASTPGDEASDTDATIDLESYFLEHDVLEPCADRDDLCLTEEFERAWFEEIEPLEESGVTTAAVADAFDFEADPDSFKIENRDGALVLVTGRATAGHWPSRAALVADVAASRVFEPWVPDWERYPPEARGQILNSLRMFLETCPTDGSDISMDEEVVESCCGSHDVIAVTCDGSGERLFEQPLDTVDA